MALQAVRIPVDLAGEDIMSSATAVAAVTPETDYELRFDSLFIEGRGLAFPCDASGQVCLDRLSERARNNYLYARTVVGREFGRPAIRRCDLH